MHHFSEARSGKQTHKNNWLRQLDALSLRPNIDVLDLTDEEHRSEREQYWIDFYLRAGHRLTNGNAGGKGGRLPTEETRKRQSEAHKGYVMPPEQRAKIGNALRGKPKTPETRARMSEAGKVKDLSAFIAANPKRPRLQ